MRKLKENRFKSNITIQDFLCVVHNKDYIVIFFDNGDVYEGYVQELWENCINDDLFANSSIGTIRAEGKSNFILGVHWKK